MIPHIVLSVFLLASPDWKLFHGPFDAPGVMELRVRASFVREGMPQERVLAILGLSNFILGSGSSARFTQTMVFPIGENHLLWLTFNEAKAGEWVFENANLQEK